MKTKLFQRDQIKEAASLLRAGKNVIFPTETVYGLGGRYDDELALDGIFKAKNRPGNNPLILHIHDRSQLKDIVEDVPEAAEALMDAFWPGPLTLIFTKKDTVSEKISAGLPSVAVRMPSHPVALALLKEVGVPVAAPSANPSGYPSPTREEHVLEMMGHVDGILLGGDAEVGIESTVLDLRYDPMRILRPGIITSDDINGLDLEVFRVKDEEESASPGVLHRHYAPRAKVSVIKGSKAAIEHLIETEVDAVFLVSDEYWKPNDNRLIRFVPEASLEHAAKEYYALLRELDRQNVKTIYILALEETPSSEALMDRMMRSADGRCLQLGDSDECSHRK